MCGICGGNFEDRELIKDMTALLQHRGPDTGAVYSTRGGSLGHRRLSIIDLSSAGRQPMTNENGTIFVVFNGEIYNHKKLRKSLEKKGHKFKSNCDTEVLVHGYEQWREKLVSKLEGQFAFAIFDEIKRKFFLARDRLGIKPLYYYWNKAEDDFYFASEIKSILATNIPRAVNKNAAHNYLNLRYVPGDDTLFEGVNKLLPGHTLSYENGELLIKEYWDLPNPSGDIVKSAEIASFRVKELLEKSVAQRLVADVPVGVYLSGGIDSATITALAAGIKEESGEAVKTFSVGFDHSNDVDELHKAARIAEHFNTDHHEIVVDDRIGEMLPKILWTLDQPHGDPVVVPMFKLSQLASTKVKVVLSGEGADEAFGGYVQYKNMLRAQSLAKMPSFVLNNAGFAPVKLLDKVYDYPSSIGEKGKEKFTELMGKLGNDKASYDSFVSIFSDNDKKLMYTDEFKEFRKEDSKYWDSSRNPLLNKMLYYDTKKWLPNYVLQVNDRMTMAHSIEGRTPFLDHKLMEYATRVDPSLKIKGKVNKFILRKAVANVLPKENVQAKKHAFFTPLDKWFDEELKDMCEIFLSPGAVKSRGYFKYVYMKRIWENYHKSKLLYGKQLFTLLNFEMWHRMYIDSDEVPKNGNISLKELL